MSSPPVPPATSRRRRWVVLAAVAGVLLVAAVAWWSAQIAAQQVTAETLGYRVESDSSTWIQFDVSRPVGMPVTCTLRAVDVHFTVVGTADVPVPPEGDRQVRLQHTIRTASRAASAVVQDCVGDRR